MKNGRKDIMSPWEEKIYEWLKNPAALLIIGSLLIWGIQQSILISVDSAEKALAKKYEVLVETSSIYTDYYQNLWNFFFGKAGNENAENMREYRKRIQSVVARAKSIEIQPPILFMKTDTSNNWNKFLEIYHDAWYKLSREELTEQELNNILNKATPYIDKVIRDICGELGYNKKQDNRLLQYDQATGDITRNRTFSDVQASGPVVTTQ